MVKPVSEITEAERLARNAYRRLWNRQNKDKVKTIEARRHAKHLEKRRAKSAEAYRIRKSKIVYADTTRGRARAEGLRSGFERTLTVQMKRLNVVYEYEPIKLPYVLERNYVPDFYLPKQNIYIEAKGKLTPEDRSKMIAVKKAHPELDIRFVFMRAENKLTKASKQTYATWAEKNGFPWADGEVPKAWLT